MTTPIKTGLKNLVSPSINGQRQNNHSSKHKDVDSGEVIWSQSRMINFLNLDKKEVTIKNIGNVVTSFLNGDMSFRSDLKFRYFRGTPWDRNYKDWNFSVEYGSATAVYAPHGRDAIAVDFGFDEKGNVNVGRGYLMKGYKNPYV